MTRASYLPNQHLIYQAGRGMIDVVVMNAVDARLMPKGDNRLDLMSR
jgi:hypothetical protein